MNTPNNLSDERCKARESFRDRYTTQMCDTAEPNTTKCDEPRSEMEQVEGTDIKIFVKGTVLISGRDTV